MTIKAKLWRYESTAAWYFITTSKKEGDTIKAARKVLRGWNSVPVEVTVGESVWKTSFFGQKDGTYLLPIKKSVRKAEDLEEGDMVTVSVRFV